MRPDQRRPLQVLDGQPGILDRLQVVDHAHDHLIEMIEGERQLQVADGAADIPGKQIERTLCSRIEAMDMQGTVEHDDGDVDRAEEIEQVVVGLRQLLIAGLQFLVEGDQLLVR